MPLIYLLFTLVGAAFTANAYRPFARDGRLAVVSFFAGWLVSELPAHHVAWQVAVTVVFVALGALASWPGWLALAIAVASWAALAYLLLGGARTRARMAQVLATSLEAAPPDAPDAPGAPPDTWGDAGIGMLAVALPFGRHGHALVRVARDVPYYPAHGARGALDVYHRGDGARGKPVLIQVHGGAWILGRKDQQGLPLMNYLAAAGWVCVAINYRLSPRATFPDHLVDVKRAIAWVRENIAQYGGDPDFIAIAGNSAGGHLASLAALTPDAREYQPGFEDRDTSVQVCVPFYGVYDFADYTGVAHPGLRQLLERDVLKTSYARDPAAFERASPVSRVTPAAPPFFVLHGTNDTLVPVAQARHFVAVLRAASRALVVYAELPGAQHAFEIFPSLRAAHVVRAVARFLTHVHRAHQARTAARLEA